MNKIKEEAKNRLIVALDYNNMEDAVKLTERLGDKISIYKVGLESFLVQMVNWLIICMKKGRKYFWI